MEKCIVISDSFKGSLTSNEIGCIASDAIRKFYPQCEVVTIPIADGGEGTADCFLQAVGGEPVTLTVTGPLGDPVRAAYARLAGQAQTTATCPTEELSTDTTESLNLRTLGDTAVIEMAAASGLTLLEGKGFDRRDPMLATTYGTGELIRHAIESGATNIIIGLGGSATNDAGCGMAAALGTKFYDSDGNEFIPTGGTLSDVSRIVTSETRKLLKGVTVTAMCDIDNPMHGPNGAAYIFGPQKGADPAMVRELDANLKALDQTLIRELGIRASEIPGAGAAGAMGAGCLAFLGASLRPGIEILLDAVDFDSLLEGTDYVFTGEGRLDSQTLQGKTISGIMKRTSRAGVPLIAIVGGALDGYEEAYDHGLTSVFTINRLAQDLSESQPHSRENYRKTIEDIIRLIRAAE